MTLKYFDIGKGRTQAWALVDGPYHKILACWGFMNFHHNRRNASLAVRMRGQQTQ